jgi:integrase/recombinase XerD
MSDYAGIFADLLTEFVTFKHAMGFKYASEAAELRRFARLSTAFPLEQAILTRELVDAWSAQRPMEGTRTQSRRIYVLRQFALFLNTMGHEAVIPVPAKPTGHYTFVPYIFTPQELDRIFAEADRLAPRNRSSLPVVVPVILRMLYGCGLRISEALHLQNRHVHLEDGVIEIIQSKFGKDRLVPMHPSLTSICQDYAAAVHPHGVPEAYFFGHRDGGPIDRDNVYRRFREVLWRSGISHGGKGKGPRLHDLRHAFAVHSLKAAVDRGVDVYAALPVLSAYLGHTSTLATEQYVRLTADCFPEIRAQVDRSAGWVIPEVAWE